MTWMPPYGKAELRCDHYDGERCQAKETFMSNGSWQHDRREMARKGWTYRSLIGDLCPAHSGSTEADDAR